MSAHLVVQRSSRNEQDILAEVTRLMSEAFHISQTTLQLENSQFHARLEENEGMQH
jgi:cobalt-zinc-cadmium efflux system protein